MKEKLWIAFVLMGLLAAPAFGTWLYLRAWNECRQTNTFFYCMSALRYRG